MKEKLIKLTLDVMVNVKDEDYDKLDYFDYRTSIGVDLSSMDGRMDPVEWDIADVEEV